MTPMRTITGVPPTITKKIMPVLAQIARSIEAGLPAGTRIAAVNFESPSARFSDYVLEELQGALVNNRKLVVTECSKLELLRNEISFQMSGEVSDESATSLGKWVGAQALITGSLTDIGGGNYRCRFNAIDVETAVQKVSPAVTIARDNTIAFMLPPMPPCLRRGFRQDPTRRWRLRTSIPALTTTRRNATRRRSRTLPARSKS
jgi:hypothetical protein